MAHRAAQLQHPNLPLLLLRGRERLLSYFRPVLNAHGLTEQQWRILRVLLEGPLEPWQICDICCISSPSLVGVLSRMQQLELIHRGPVAGDQRRVRISATPRARRLAAEIIPEIESAYRGIESSVGASLLRQLQGLLDELLSSLPPFSEELQAELPATGTRETRTSSRSPIAKLERTRARS